jgi:tRNA-dihydrouridine synthase C
VSIPVAANGEVWSVADAMRCRQESGGNLLMLGRGMVVDPGLALAIRHADDPAAHAINGVTWDELLPLIDTFWHLVYSRLDRRKQAGRLKQWLNFLRRRYPQADMAYQELRTVDDPAVVAQWLQRNRASAQNSCR